MNRLPAPPKSLMETSPAPARLPLVLLFLRVSIFVVMAMWTLDKFIHPDHAASVYERYYALRGFAPSLMYALAAAESLLLLAFLLGICRRLTYGLVLLLHSVSTLSAWAKYANPFEKPNLLFFAAWPMLAACFALYILRASDTLGTVPPKRT